MSFVGANIYNPFIGKEIGREKKKRKKVSIEPPNYILPVFDNKKCYFLLLFFPFFGGPFITNKIIDLLPYKKWIDNST